MQQLAQQRNRLLGYPINMTTPPEEFFAWRNELAAAGFNQFSFNNVGNPYDHSHIPFNCHPFEKELINRFGAVYGFAPDDIWGFLSNSGTDSNMHGLYMGRTILKSRTGVMPKIYFTREAHYSIQILRDLLHLDWVVVATRPDGGMDTDDLERQLNANPNHSALVVATIGTTFKGATDPVDTIQAKLKGRAAYLHLDAALFGGYLPHTAFAGDLLHSIVDPISKAKLQRYDSIAVSCHKFLASPRPPDCSSPRARTLNRFAPNSAKFMTRNTSSKYRARLPARAMRSNRPSFISSVRIGVCTASCRCQSNAG